MKTRKLILAVATALAGLSLSLSLLITKQSVAQPNLSELANRAKAEISRARGIPVERLKVESQVGLAETGIGQFKLTVLEEICMISLLILLAIVLVMKR